MKRIRRLGVVGALAVAAVGGLSGPAGAAPALVHGTGTYQVTGVTVRSSHQVGPYTVVEQSLEIANDGVLSGPSVADVTCLFGQSGEGACAGVEHFNGSIGGHSGSADFAVGLTVGATGFKGSFVAVRSSGGLSGLSGAGTFQGGPTGTNAFDYAFR